MNSNSYSDQDQIEKAMLIVERLGAWAAQTMEGWWCNEEDNGDSLNDRIVNKMKIDA